MARDAAPAIVAKNLGIQFWANGRRRKLRAREYLVRGKTTATKDQFWALRNVSFTVPRGQAVGLVGGNGHGKSTLLKIIAGVMLPDEGWVKVDRKGVAPMIEVTGGFIGDLSVRDNIWLAAGLYGLSNSQIRRRFNSIVEWAEIENRLNTPFRHLSSGMKARVGFSVITSIDRPIVLVDEVLSVGDRAFRQKCMVRMEEMLGENKTVVLVSHNEAQLKKFCTRGLYLRHGELVADGPIDDVLAQYMAEADRLAAEAMVPRVRPPRPRPEPDPDVV